MRSVDLLPMHDRHRVCGRLLSTRAAQHCSRRTNFDAESVDIVQARRRGQAPRVLGGAQQLPEPVVEVDLGRLHLDQDSLYP